MASDRRITVKRGRVTLDQRDRATKTFVLWGQMLMGYTGVAILDGKPMEMWAADRLMGVRPNDAPHVLAEEMSRFYARHRGLEAVPHSFQAVGFAVDASRPRINQPLAFTVTNCDWSVVNGRLVPQAVRADFSVRFARPGNQGIVVGAIGASSPITRLRALRAALKQSARGNPTEPARAYQPLVGFTREVASTSDGTVGDVVTVTSLPRFGVPYQDLGVTVPLSDEVQATPSDITTRTFYPPDAVERRVQWMPAIVHQHAVVAGSSFAEGPDPVDPPDFPRSA